MLMSHPLTLEGTNETIPTWNCWWLTREKDGIDQRERNGLFVGPKGTQWLGRVHEGLQVVSWS